MTDNQRYLEYLRKDFDLIFDDKRPDWRRNEIDNLFYIYLANFEYCMQCGDYAEAHDSMTDLFCYNTNDSRIKYLISCAIAPYKETT